MRTLLVAVLSVVVTSLLWLAILAGRPRPPLPHDEAAGASPAHPAPLPADERQRLRARIASLEAALAEARAAAPADGGEREEMPAADDAAPTGPEARADDPPAGRTEPGGDPPVAPGAGDPLLGAVLELDRVMPGGLERNDEFWGRLARLYRMADDPVNALSCYLKAFRLDPDDWDWRDGIASIDPVLRLPALQDLVREFPEDDELLGDLADAYAELDMDGAAADAYLAALELDPGDSEWREKLVGADPGRAIPMLERLAGEEVGDVDALANLGDAYLHEGRPGEALATYERAYASDPTNDELSERLVRLDPARAIVLLEQTLALEPGHDELWGDLGDAYQATGSGARAATAYQRAIGLDPDDDEWVGKLSEADPQLAISFWEERLRRYPRDDEAWGNLADTLVVAGRPDDALHAYRRALELDPDDLEWPDKISRLERATD